MNEPKIYPKEHDHKVTILSCKYLNFINRMNQFEKMGGVSRYKPMVKS